MLRKFLYFSIFLITLFSSAIFAESFRVRKVVLAEVSAQNRVQKVELGYNDALSVQVPKDLTFFEGVEIEVKIPQELLEYRGSIAYSLYENVSPMPSEESIDYEGKRLVVEALPSRLGVVLQIPIVPDHSIKSSPYATILPICNVLEDGQLLLRFQPVMKGLPLDIEDLVFHATVKPLLTNEGLLDLKVEYPSESTQTEFFLFINEDQTPFNNQPLLLPVGMHHLSIVSEYFRNEVRTFSVNQAETTRVAVALQDIAPTLFITAPDNATVYVNDRETEVNTTIVVEPGEYTVRVLMGDYEVIKNITAVLGKSYDIVLQVDVLITETP